MSTNSSVTVSPLAYKKLILHAAKYPTARVLGFLLADTTSAQTINIVDSIPLSHHWTALAPMAEVALSLATSYASSKKLSVVGLYEAPELTSERNPSPQANKLTEKIASLTNAEALLLLVNNATLLKAGEHSLSGFIVSSPTNGKGDAKPKALAASAVALQDQSRAAELESAVRKDSTWDKIIDFDGKYHLYTKSVACATRRLILNSTFLDAFGIQTTSRILRLTGCRIRPSRHDDSFLNECHPVSVLSIASFAQYRCVQTGMSTRTFHD
ncbi:hypothetical protein PHSY_000646 [Pseudozyma hubeiensis SY62]|uniref:MPN domain-containing protein n=1 Tax=Pseudozyma hubeiensis (strain SY62) TaxID=1305764 RepID=R9P4P8_PSEHS|nr:hypothetical protein PHSY_000646 [Pseudozyma hubeiensis SY62]GAC93085.1 hypothetical protein PHSY_000646 [Pseudozyma hubeiensis SY62]